MVWSYVQLDDGTQLAYSETREGGTVHVAVGRFRRWPSDVLQLNGK